MVQVHSITARSVSRQFRESLKAGKSELVDTIFKLPDVKQSTRQQDTVTNIINDKVRQTKVVIGDSPSPQANVVYSSKSPHDLYPDGDYVRGEGDVSSSEEGDLLHLTARHW